MRGLIFCLVKLFSAWKNVGMTMTCNTCDVMNIMWRKYQMAQKSDRERRGDGRWGRGGGRRGRGGGERERERERERCSFIYIYIYNIMDMAMILMSTPMMHSNEVVIFTALRTCVQWSDFEAIVSRRMTVVVGAQRSDYIHGLEVRTHDVWWYTRSDYTQGSRRLIIHTACTVSTAVSWNW